MIRISGEQMLKTCCSFLLLFALLLTGAQPALAAAVSVAPSGNGVFIISGSGMDTVAGIDLLVNYDTALLGAPTVNQGNLLSGALMVANTNNPGAIKIAAVSTSHLPASGQIAMVSFGTHTGTGKVSVAASMINAKGVLVSGSGNSTAADFQTAASPATGFIKTAGIPFNNQGADTTVNTPAAVTSSSTTASGQTYLGTVTMPGDAPPKSDPKPTEPASPPPAATEPASPHPAAAEPAVARQSEQPVEVKAVPAPQKTEPVKMTVYKSSAEQFSTYKGEKSPGALIALLGKQVAPDIRQEPAFVLSDGRTTVKILAEVKDTGDKAPNFALLGARLVSLTIDNSSAAWVVEALPQAGVQQANLTILTDSAIIEYPLTLAPPVATVSAAEADFIAFLKDSGATPPRQDLNGDGRHDHLDDFIYTVNYLSRKGAAGREQK